MEVRFLDLPSSGRVPADTAANGTVPDGTAVGAE
jgi:hypothetical protein